MKKLLLILAIVALALSACGKSDSKDTVTISSAATLYTQAGGKMVPGKVVQAGTVCDNLGAYKWIEDNSEVKLYLVKCPGNVQGYIIRRLAR
jgi:outer membrane protein assembly factor BamD (BamD/ComL family)